MIRWLAIAMVAITGRAAPERLVVDAVLRGTSPSPEPGVYVRALVLYTYEVAGVVEGRYTQPRIQVYHWAVLDRQVVPETVDRRKGQIYRLVVEPFNAYRALAREDRTETQLDTDLPLYMDTSLGVLPTLCTRVARLQKQETTVVAGNGGRLFLVDELAHYAQPATNAAPVKAIVDFVQQAKRAGAEVIVVPVPGKVALYPESLGVPAPQDDYIGLLGKEGVTAFDLLPAMQAMREAGGNTHCRTDSHWTPAAMQLAAGKIAEMIGGRPAPATFDQETAIVTGDLVALAGLEPASEELVFQRPLKCPPIDDAASPVVLMGDSHAIVYSWPIAGGIQIKGAGFGEHLAAALGRSVDTIATAGSGANASRLTLARRKDNLAGKKWLVWVFAAREFTRAPQGWATVPVSGPLVP